MAAPKISEQEKQILRNNAKAELKRMEDCLSDQSTVQLMDAFKNKFNICETVYKVILAEHQRCKGKEHCQFLKVDMTQVPYALAFAGYSFDKALLNELFGASSKKGKTVKKLRDGITHGINEAVVKEIQMREKELFSYMEAFLSGIRSFDNFAA